jgi:hypothetical protein
MVDDKKVDAKDVCIFEMTERVGGRLFSLRGLGPESDFTVDAGGYRTVRKPKVRRKTTSLDSPFLIFLPSFATLITVAQVYSNGSRPYHRILGYSDGLL